MAPASERSAVKKGKAAATAKKAEKKTTKITAATAAAKAGKTALTAPVRGPNGRPDGLDFCDILYIPDDETTVRTTLAWILGQGGAQRALELSRPIAERAQRRQP
ncbi:hypothetical protein JM49_18750 [Pseudomonas chlororaphis subsp. aurantiaca]|uniref:Uncharacterized protein n=1 Tax=Pseudomonas chlororaphis subsp. aurantiaca TaxID=86192 RepID=A0AAJ0ZGU4_9PSED|nr:hypothetical protein [Pseudomonas chlororaphis]AIS13615.1 hypothetical protein JM49_18750 [Pseudomonas chlororaphis subsp. aurantiaca]MBU4632328.1 hypothetical protein [Pseudomonas chlororaphis subsp. aurantiaca]